MNQALGVQRDELVAALSDSDTALAAATTALMTSAEEMAVNKAQAAEQEEYFSRSTQNDDITIHDLREDLFDRYAKNTSLDGLNKILRTEKADFEKALATSNAEITYLLGEEKKRDRDEKSYNLQVNEALEHLKYVTDYGETELGPFQCQATGVKVLADQTVLVCTGTCLCEEGKIPYDVCVAKTSVQAQELYVKHHVAKDNIPCLDCGAGENTSAEFTTPRAHVTANAWKRVRSLTSCISDKEMLKKRQKHTADQFADKVSYEQKERVTPRNRVPIGYGSVSGK